MTECQNGGENFDLSYTPRMDVLSDIQVQGLAHQQAAAFRLPAAQLEKDSSQTAPPCLGVLDAGITSSQRISREFKITKWSGMKKGWHWPWPSRDMLFVLECPQGCSAEQHKSSIGALPQ